MNLIQSLTGLGTLTEQVIAADCLQDTGDSVACWARALTEATTPSVRLLLRQQLDATLAAQERLLNYTLGKGYSNPVNPQEQLRMDMQAADRMMSTQPGS